MKRQTISNYRISCIVKMFLLCMVFGISMSVFAQVEEPSWLDADIRNAYYPQDNYYTGFAEVAVTQSETREKAMNKAKQRAIAELSDRVRVTVNTQKRSADISYMGTDVEERIYSKFTSLVQTTSQTEVVGSKVDSYYSPQEAMAYAFAYVSKNELKNYYQNQISFYLNQVESSLATAAELADKGYKMKARSECLAVVDAFAAIAYAQDLLTAIDGSVTDAVLQQSRSGRLRNELVQNIVDLENSIYVFLECSEMVNGQSVVHIADRLPGMLTEEGCGCNFTNIKEEADYVIKVNARLSRCQDAPDNIVFCYANATVSVLNTGTQKTLMPKISETKGGWTQRNRANATEEAFNELAEKIVEAVVPLIKN